jgi:hypothetical protein
MREYFPDRRECGPLRLAAGYRHRCPIATTTRAQLRAWSSRRYPAWAAAAVLLVTVAGVIVTTVELVQTPTAPDDYRNGALIAICYAVPYAVTGAFLVARRPDLPFGWLLAAAAVLAAVGTAADAMIYVTVSHGASQRLAFVVYALSITQLLPTAVQGLVNVRFPSGRLSSRRARVLEIALITGIVLGFAAGLLGDQTLPLARPDGSVDQVSNPLTHGTLVGRIADDLSVVVPVVILLGLIAGLGVVRRACHRHRAVPAALAGLRCCLLAAGVSLRRFHQRDPGSHRPARRAALRSHAGHPGGVVPAVGDRYGNPPVRRLRAGHDRRGGNVRADRRGRHRGGQPADRVHRRRGGGLRDVRSRPRL